MATSPFFTDQVFESCEELMQWVQNTAFSLGYIIVTRRSKAKENGVVSYVTLICDRGGEYKFKESSKKSGTKKTNCKFRLEQDENNVSTLKTIYNARQKLRSSQNVGECIPLGSIDVFWRKLNLSPSTSVENEDICCDELNKEPARHSSYITEIPDLNQEPLEQVSDFIDLNQMPESCDTHPLMKEIPNMFHPYITHVQDVRDELLSSYDVNARVFTDGIDELRNSLCFSQSLAPAEHWMVMPMTGVLIANRFGVILNYLTK
ncbi:hypothetical protein GOBAR_AA06424 [Gossypium barbadense]|uniref:FAR1 domain-containing protein n=1 Tax=Gossypium barbadense TaxID=3634 RepID=A0A2P5YF01_GOSBA|nr:hypothetical protein GOBAR_AA06424 [Gossypium barbadense]